MFGIWAGMFEYNLYSIFLSITAGKTLYTLRVSLLLSSSNDVSADTVDVEGSFEFPPKAEFTSPLYVHITLATDTDAAASCFSQLRQYSQNILKLFAFKCFLSDVLLEPNAQRSCQSNDLSQVNVSFSKFSFLISFF